ncbi:MAG: thiol-disulfide isomerase/thioredoxin [Oceanospirillaceae bacterium]|jgi:thiol-disulfide isomerase/thioredoxin
MNLIEIKHFWSKQIADAKLNVPANLHNYKTLTVTIHNASWCPDCEREVSQLLALDAQAEHGFDSITVHSYEDIEDYKKRKIAGALVVTCLPTLIFYQEGQEVLRVEEDSAGQLSSQLCQLQNSALTRE